MMLAILSLGFSPAPDTGLRDHPIGAQSVTYLDGKWTATSSNAQLDCAFADGTDYKPANGTDSGRKRAADNKEQCCALCLSDSLCTVAVYDGDACWTKTAADAGGGAYSRDGRVACAPRTSSSAASLTIDAAVPGDLLTDLQNAGQIGDPLVEKNFLNSSLWAARTWTYSTTFAAPAAWRAAGGQNLLVFDGIKMGATVKLNGQTLGVAVDQFLRYTFEVPPALLTNAAEQTLDVVFDPSIDVKGRFMSCTGGWDWAPYSHDSQGDALTFSKGIWKSVYLAHVPPAAVALTHIVPQPRYLGPYPTTPLVDGHHGGFTLGVRVFLSAAAATSGTLSLAPSWGPVAEWKVDVPKGDSNVTLHANASATQVKLWWPAGMGSQPLYDLTVTFTPEGGGLAASASASRKVGFRQFALVTGNDTDPDFVARAATEEGSASHGMFWRVNGAAVWSKGANMIPMEELEGRMNAEAHRILVRSAADGGFNTLRVWGGGMFLPDAWYDECDKLGIMVYHDMQYAQSGHAPAGSATEDAELRHMVRRLSHHASIVMWDGCNECRVIMGTDTAIYATFVMTVVAQEDASRAVWPSCPALGWTTGVHKLDATPNGNALTTPKDGKTLETHGPYLHGTGFPAVNGAAKLQLFDANLPIKVTAAPTGVDVPNVFASEFGAVVMSSFESMSPTLLPYHWSLHASQPPDTCGGGFGKTCVGPNAMAERNYPCDNLIDVYFGTKGEYYFNVSSEANFKAQLYQCQLSQALYMKSNIETRRAQNQLGHLVWQYNEIWPTGGWGSIEYGSPRPGQVLGGRWKPLQYFYRRSIFADVMATCGDGGACYVRNDRAGRPFEGSCTVASLEFATGATKTLHTLDLTGKSALAPGAGVTRFFTVDLSAVDASTHMLTASCAPVAADAATTTSCVRAGAVGASGAADASLNEILLAPPAALALPPAAVTATVAQAANADGTVDVTLKANATALYVTLTTAAQGRFTDNAFAVTAAAAQVVQFVPFDGFDKGELERTLRVEHLAERL